MEEASATLELHLALVLVLVQKCRQCSAPEMALGLELGHPLPAVVMGVEENLHCHLSGRYHVIAALLQSPSG